MGMLRPLRDAVERFRYRKLDHRLMPQSSYEDYRRTQSEGNARKLGRVSAEEANIAWIASYATEHIGPDLSVLCHGTRNGAELRWFKEHLPDARQVLGTDIADSAAQFPDTIQWDFHDIKDEWRGAWDVIYSNSWDHAFEPERAFRNWLACLAPRGMLVLEHTDWHMPAFVTSLDPFGATLKGLRELLDRCTGPGWSVEVIDTLPVRDIRQRLVILRRSPLT